jgi:hypothetical protein
MAAAAAKSFIVLVLVVVVIGDGWLRFATTIFVRGTERVRLF